MKILGKEIFRKRTEDTKTPEGGNDFSSGNKMTFEEALKKQREEEGILLSPEFAEKVDVKKIDQGEKMLGKRTGKLSEDEIRQMAVETGSVVDLTKIIKGKRDFTNGDLVTTDSLTVNTMKGLRRMEKEMLQEKIPGIVQGVVAEIRKGIIEQGDLITLRRNFNKNAVSMIQKQLEGMGYKNLGVEMSLREGGVINLEIRDLTSEGGAVFRGELDSIYKEQDLIRRAI